MFSVYARKKAVEDAELCFADLANRNLEGLGLLLGDVCEHNGKEFIVIDEFVTGPTDSTAVSVRFSPQGLVSVAQLLTSKLDSNRVVGWCHSHPGYGCFLSSTDVATQGRFFNESYHTAAVFDPLASEKFNGVKAMAKRFYHLKDNGYSEVSFAVF